MKFIRMIFEEENTSAMKNICILLMAIGKWSTSSRLRYEVRRMMWFSVRHLYGLCALSRGEEK